jgi:hypothetical protein
MGTGQGEAGQQLSGSARLQRFQPQQSVAQRPNIERSTKDSQWCCAYITIGWPRVNLIMPHILLLLLPVFGGYAVISEQS